ncbi:hypothetical protein H2200_011541 [Cladophialophora chaetospira]|uniref:Uncharacterized protein n=1 Tax=Cladophialophora chaetospira TaxID=386627 RepID=A0AA38WZI2_9EURO|nr:hypothetical protein H2200_011541 [Cladophialophora chaetospira]
MADEQRIKHDLACLELEQRQLFIDRERFELQQRLVTLQTRSATADLDTERSTLTGTRSPPQRKSILRQPHSFVLLSNGRKIFKPRPTQRPISNNNETARTTLVDQAASPRQTVAHKSVGDRVPINVFQNSDPASIADSRSSLLEHRESAGLPPLQPQRRLSIHAVYRGAHARQIFEDLARIEHDLNGQAQKKRKQHIGEKEDEKHF